MANTKDVLKYLLEAFAVDINEEKLQFALTALNEDSQKGLFLRATTSRTQTFHEDILRKVTNSTFQQMNLSLKFDSNVDDTKSFLYE